jgi:hypothetical protein
MVYSFEVSQEVFYIYVFFPLVCHASCQTIAHFITLTVWRKGNQLQVIFTIIPLVISLRPSYYSRGRNPRNELNPLLRWVTTPSQQITDCVAPDLGTSLAKLGILRIVFRTSGRPLIWSDASRSSSLPHLQLTLSEKWRWSWGEGE